MCDYVVCEVRLAVILVLSLATQLISRDYSIGLILVFELKHVDRSNKLLSRSGRPHGSADLKFVASEHDWLVQEILAIFSSYFLMTFMVRNSWLQIFLLLLFVLMVDCLPLSASLSLLDWNTILVRALGLRSLLCHLLP